MPHGGRRAGAGRKSNAELQTMRTLLDSAVSEEQWRQLMRRLFQHALKGNIQAVQLLLSYRFGDPYAVVTREEDIKQIQFVKTYESRPDPITGEYPPLVEVVDA